MLHDRGGGNDQQQTINEWLLDIEIPANVFFGQFNKLEI